MDKLYIFARTFEQAVNYVRENHLGPYDYTIVNDVSRVQGVRVELDQIVVVGEWYLNADVSLAYDYVLYSAKQRMKECSL